MKKLIIILFVASFLLTACFNPIAVSVVEDMYEAALLEDEAEISSYFSDAYLEEHSLEELSAELAEHVRYAGGVKLLNTVELPRNRLNESIVTELDNAYGDDWYFIVLDAGEGEVMTWTVIKGSSQYEVVAGEKMTVDSYNEDVLN